MEPGACTWSDRGLTERLRDTRFHDLRWFEALDSTNTYALGAARDGVLEGLVVVADEQGAGRGRLGRRWVSPPGASLLVSVLLRRDPSHAQPVTMATALALADAVDAVAGFRPGLKWPNDLVVGDRKLAGVLAEADGWAVVVGAGCNVRWGAFPAELAETATSCDLESQRQVEREELLVRFLRTLHHLLDRPAETAAGYRSQLQTLGQYVRVERAADTVLGQAVDLDDDGALVVMTDDRATVRIHAGDVVHLRNP